MQDHKEQTNDYSFLRQLTKQISQTECALVIASLQEKGIELYRKEEEGVSLILDGKEADEKKNDGQLYISAADREAAVQILQKAGLGSVISEEQMISRQKSLVEEAEEEYLKKRKIHRIECVAVLIIAVLYYLYRL